MKEFYENPRSQEQQIIDHIAQNITDNQPMCEVLISLTNAYQNTFLYPSGVLNETFRELAQHFLDAFVEQLIEHVHHFLKSSCVSKNHYFNYINMIQVHQNSIEIRKDDLLDEIDCPPFNEKTFVQSLNQFFQYAFTNMLQILGFYLKTEKEKTKWLNNIKKHIFQNILNDNELQIKVMSCQPIPIEQPPLAIINNAFVLKSFSNEVKQPTPDLMQIVNHLKSLTSACLKEVGIFRPAHSILKALCSILDTELKTTPVTEKITQFYRVFNAPYGNTRWRNHDILAHDQSRTTKDFVLGVIAIAGLLAGILPGLLILGGISLYRGRAISLNELLQTHGKGERLTKHLKVQEEALEKHGMFEIKRNVI